MLNRTQAVLHVVAELADLAEGVGVRVTEFDFGLQFRDTRVLLRVVAGVDGCATIVAVVANDAADAVAVQQTETEGGACDTQAEACARYALACVLVLASSMQPC